MKESIKEVWKLSEFSSKVGVHYNTIDRWFKQLEEERIHYVNRVSGTKVYDQLDLEIAEYIGRKRKNDWGLQGIFDMLPQEIEVRPFPLDFNGPTANPMIDLERLKTSLLQELIETTKHTVEEQWNLQLKQLLSVLPKPEEERAKRLNELLAHRKVERKLRKEALTQWETKPDSERLKKAGFFRKEEDAIARERFILDYLDEHYENEIRKEYNDYEG